MVGPASWGFAGEAASRFNAAVLGLDSSLIALVDALCLLFEDRSPPNVWWLVAALKVGDGGPDPASEPGALDSPSPSAAFFDLSRRSSDFAS